MKLIVAVNNKGVIGHAGKIPWKCKADMQHFKELTGEGVVIMGRNTWDSLPKKPLPKRLNVVLSSTLEHTDVNGGDFNVDALVAKSIEDILFVESMGDAAGWEESWVIGGHKLYDALVNDCREIHISHINDDSDGDTKWAIPEDFKGEVFHYNFEPDDDSNRNVKQT